MYSNPINTIANGLNITTFTPDDARCLTKIRYTAYVEADYRIKAALSASKETRGGYSNCTVLDTFEVRWTVGGKFYAVKKLATEAEALAVAADRWAKVVAKLEARAARLAA